MDCMSTFGIKWRKMARHEAGRSDGETRQSDDEETPRRSYSLRALIPGPYVRYPER